MSDPLADVKPGDKDPTGNDQSAWCNAEHPENPRRLLLAHRFCSREPGHPGQHIAGDSVYVVGAWTTEGGDHA